MLARCASASLVDRDAVSARSRATLLIAFRKRILSVCSSLSAKAQTFDKMRNVKTVDASLCSFRRNVRRFQLGFLIRAMLNEVGKREKEKRTLKIENARLRR